MVSIRLPAPRKGLSPFGWGVVASVAIALVLAIVAIAFIRTSDSSASAQIAVSAPQAANAPASNAPAAVNSNQIQRLGPAALRNTPEAELGQKALEGSFPRAFTNTFAGDAALLTCKQAIGKKNKSGGGESTNTILEGTTMSEVVQSITWRRDLKHSYYGTTSDGTITLGFSRVAGEPKISSVSC